MSNGNYLMGSGISQWKEGKAYEVTFIVTEDCNLRCSYCYEVHKNEKHRMSFDVAKKAIDYLLDNPQMFNAEAVLWDFIGGEPLLEIDLIDRIMDYIKIKTYKLGHKWSKNYRIHIGTNGTLYDRSDVQRFIKKNKGKLDIGITIDGTKRKHDMHRIYQNGKGSYDDVYKNLPLWLQEFPNSTTKVTFGSEDLIYLKESIVHLWENGLSIIPANVVFEDVWKEGDDKIFEQQMRNLADYIIEFELWDKVNCTLFDDMIGMPNDRTIINSNYCGTGRMLAIDAQGNFYPCLRFSDFTLCEKQGIPIGDIDTGIDYDKIRPFLTLSTKAISNDECLNCEIASGCAWCQGCNYDCTVEDTIYARATYICKMHKARVRANNYYWDRLRREKGIDRKSPLRNKKHLYFIMSDDAVECCDYSSNSTVGAVMSEEVAKSGLEFCEKNFYKPVILNSKSQDNIIDLDRFSTISRIELCHNDIKLPYSNYDKYVVIDSREVTEFKGNEIVLLNIHEESFPVLADMVTKLLPICQRINIIFKFEFQRRFSTIYKEQLELMIAEIVSYLKRKEFREINILTDRLFLDEMNNCNCGVHNYALAPNGKLYICPAFYFNSPEDYIGDIETGITKYKLADMLSLSNSPLCKRCDAYQCNRCVLLNRKKTREFNTPGSAQCIKSHIERNASMKLLQILHKEKIEYGADIEIPVIDYSDPIECVIEELVCNPYARHYC